MTKDAFGIRTRKYQSYQHHRDLYAKNSVFANLLKARMRASRKKPAQKWRRVANGFRTCVTDFAAIVRHKINYTSSRIIMQLSTN